MSTCDDVAKALVGTGFGYRADVARLQAAEIARLLPTVRDVRRLGLGRARPVLRRVRTLDAYVERGLKPGTWRPVS